MIWKSDIAIAAIFLMFFFWAFSGGGIGVDSAAGFGTPWGLLVPAAPRNVRATAVNGAVTVDFELPQTDGGSPILCYTVMSYPGNITVKGARRPVIVTGLTKGKTYVFTVTASNSVGTGRASLPSNCVTPGE